MKKASLLLASGIVCLSLTAANAAVIVQDSFGVNITDDPGDPVDGDWTVFGTPGTASYVGDGTNGVLDQSGGDGYDGVRTDFSAFTMSSAGDSISFSAKVRHDVVSVIATGFRIALINTDGTNPDATSNDTYGFMFALNLNDGPGSGAGIYEATNNTVGGGGKLGGSSSLDLSGGNVWQTVNGTITYLGGNDFQFSFGVDGNNYVDEITYTDVNPTLTYNRIVFGLGGSGAGTGFQLDDVNVTTVVPEPSSMSAGLLAGICGLVFRRSR